MQKTKSTFSLYFKTRKPSRIPKDWDGQEDVYLIINVDGDRKEIGLKRKIKPEDFDKVSGYMKTKTKETKEWNDYMDACRTKIKRHRTEMLERMQHVTADDLRNQFVGFSIHGTMLMDFYDKQIVVMDKMVKEGVRSVGTLNNLKFYRVRLLEFLTSKLRVNDVHVSKITEEFCKELKDYFMYERHLKKNTLSAYLVVMGKVMRDLMKKHGLNTTCLEVLQVGQEEGDIDPLTIDEVYKLMALDELPENRERDRDIFVFCCFTGLAFADVKKLKHSEIGLNINGSRWLVSKRQKTDSKIQIPLMQICIDLIEKYKGYPTLRKCDLVFPVKTLSNYEINIKKVAEAAGITKRVSSHVARHSCATIMLNHGVPIETVKEILAHSSIKQTERYAKIKQPKVNKDMNEYEKTITNAVNEQKLKVVNE